MNACKQGNLDLFIFELGCNVNATQTQRKKRLNQNEFP